MSATRVPADEQYRLIMECRTSGLTDYEWCLQHDIKPGTFYNWVKRLRKKGSELPAAARHHPPHHQEVVKIELAPPDKAAGNVLPSLQEDRFFQAPDGVMELSISGTVLRIPNGTDPALLKQTLLILRELSC